MPVACGRRGRCTDTWGPAFCSSARIPDSSENPRFPDMWSSTKRGDASAIRRAIRFTRPDRSRKSTSHRIRTGTEKSMSPSRREVHPLYPERFRKERGSVTFRRGRGSRLPAPFPRRGRIPPRAFVPSHPLLPAEQLPNLSGDLLQRADPVDPGPDLRAHEVQLVDPALDHQGQHAEVFELLLLARLVPRHRVEPLLEPPDDVGVALRNDHPNLPAS